MVPDIRRIAVSVNVEQPLELGDVSMTCEQHSSASTGDGCLWLVAPSVLVSSVALSMPALA